MTALLWPLLPGGAANPYVSVEVGDEKRRTAVETSTVSPVWDEEIMVFSETSLRNVSAGSHGTSSYRRSAIQTRIAIVTEPKDGDTRVYGVDPSASQDVVLPVFQANTSLDGSRP